MFSDDEGGEDENDDDSDDQGDYDNDEGDEYGDENGEVSKEEAEDIVEVVEKENVKPAATNGVILTPKVRNFLLFPLSFFFFIIFCL